MRIPTQGYQECKQIGLLRIVVFAQLIAQLRISAIIVRDCRKVVFLFI